MFNFECQEISGAAQVISTPPSEFKMVENELMQYVASAAIPSPGDVTFVIKKYTEGGVHVDYWNNRNPIGARTGEEIFTSLNLDFGTDDIVTGWNDPCSAKLYFKVKVPFTGPVTFELSAFSNAALFIRGEFIASSVNGLVASKEVPDLTADELLTCMISFVDVSGAASLSLKWSYDDQVSVDIPTESIYKPEFDHNSPLNDSLDCFDGYSAVIKNGIPGWDVVWGDSKKHDRENWDDGNSNNGDGWSSECEIEDYWIWSGGNVTNRDTWSRCPSGQSAPDGKKCQYIWGDGVRGGEDEEWDIKNRTLLVKTCSGCSINSNAAWSYTAMGRESIWEEWIEGKLLLIITLFNNHNSFWRK